MNMSELKELVESGREIEFSYNTKLFSITYGMIDNEEVISFCECNGESTEVACFEELITIKRHGVTLEEMLTSITEEEIWIF